MSKKYPLYPLEEEHDKSLRRDVCVTFYGALRSNNAADLEDYIEDGTLFSDDQSMALAQKVMDLFWESYAKQSVVEVVKRLPTLLEELIPDVPEDVRELAYGEILRGLYHLYDFGMYMNLQFDSNEQAAEYLKLQN